MFTREQQVTLVLAKASADPRCSVTGLHHQIVARFQQMRASVTLRRFSWEGTGEHTYRYRDEKGPDA